MAVQSKRWSKFSPWGPTAMKILLLLFLDFTMKSCRKVEVHFLEFPTLPPFWMRRKNQVMGEEIRWWFSSICLSYSLLKFMNLFWWKDCYVECFFCLKMFPKASWKSQFELSSKSKIARSLDINLVSDCLPTSIDLRCKLNAFSNLVSGKCLQRGWYALKGVVMEMPVQSYITSVNQDEGTGD